MSIDPALLVLHDLRALGVRVWTHGDVLRFEPRSAVPQRLLERMRRLKESLISRVCTEGTPRRVDSHQPAVAPCPRCRGVIFFARTERLTWICARCHPPVEPDAMVWRTGLQHRGASG